MSVCVRKSDAASSEGSNAARMVPLSPEPAVNSNKQFLLTETRKKEICESNSNAGTQDGTPAPAGVRGRAETWCQDAAEWDRRGLRVSEPPRVGGRRGGACQGIIRLMLDKSKCIFTVCVLVWALIKCLISGKRLLNKVGNCSKLKCHQGVAHFCFHNRKASQCRLF